MKPQIRGVKNTLKESKMKTVIFNTVQDLVIPMDEKDALSFKNEVVVNN